MKIASVLWRFTGCYVLLLVAATLVGSLLRLSSTFFATVALIFTVSWICGAYARANGRYFTPSEQWRVLGGMLAIDMGIVLFGLLAGISLKDLGISTVLSIAVSIVLFHAVLIYGVLWWEGRRFARRSQ